MKLWGDAARYRGSYISPYRCRHPRLSTTPYRASRTPEDFLTLSSRPRLWRCVLMAMLVPLGFVAFWPSPIDAPVAGPLAAALGFLHGQGIPTWFNYQFVEASANVILFVPIGLVSALAFPGLRRWQVGIFGLLISGGIEVGQLIFLHDRFATPVDLLTNTSGAVMGALLAGATDRMLTDRKLQAHHLSATDL